MTFAIRAEGLVRRFGATTALDGVDLEVPTGTVLGLLGPNGAGKTTAVRILATLLRPDAGTPPSAASTWSATPDQVRQLIGLTGQYASVDEDLTGTENLRADRPPAGPVPARRQGPGRASCWSGSSSPTPPTGRPRPTPAACGAGSTWRPAWSAARRCSSSTSRPPGSTRAAATRCGTWCAGWSPTGSTVLLTTQYLEEADQLADEIAVVDHGRVIAQGTPGRAEVQDRRPDADGPAGRGRADLPDVLAVVREVTGTTPEVNQTTVTAPGHRPGRAARRGAPARRRRGAGRRAGPAPVQPRRGLPLPHRPPGRGRHGRPRRHRRHPGREPGMTAATVAAPSARPAPTRRLSPAAGLRHTVHAGLAQPGADQAQPDGTARPEHPAGDVRAALHVRLRRGDLRQPGGVPARSRCPASSCRTPSSPP